MSKIDRVRQFWNEHPLWTGEARSEPGSVAFFEEHRATYYNDCFAGKLDDRLFPAKQGRVLDLGCGIGFWLVEFWQRGFRDLTGADISTRSLKIAQRRCEAYGVKAQFLEENAEALSFPDASFDHVNCQGVVHHTVNPALAVREIHRVLKPGGTAAISVYYKNFALRQFQIFRPFIGLLGRLGAKLGGRGREGIYAVRDAAEIVRLYDGVDNPIGLAYSRREFVELIGDGFRIDEIYFHFFPARSLPFRIPRLLHQLLDRKLPFMIYARLTRI